MAQSRQKVRFVKCPDCNARIYLIEIRPHPKVRGVCSTCHKPDRKVSPGFKTCDFCRKKALDGSKDRWQKHKLQIEKEIQEARRILRPTRGTDAQILSKSR